MSESIGTVISTMMGPSPSELDFVVKEGKVHRGQFVEMDYSEGTLVAMVVDVIKTNRYFERAESVKEFESSGQALFEQFPVTDWEYLLAKTRPLGVHSANGIRRPTYPPGPGTLVKNASPDRLKQFLGFSENGLHWGELEYHPLSVKPDLNRLLQKHLAILAISGAGKSVATKSLIEELLDRPKERGRIAVVVLDVHGEYTSFAQPVMDGKYVDYSKKTKIVKGKELRVGVPKLDSQLLGAVMPNLTAIQRRELGNTISTLQKEMRSGLGPFDLQSVRNALMANEEISSKTKEGLMAWLGELDSLNLFDKIDFPSLHDVVKPGELTVIDLSEVTNFRKKQIIASYLASKLFYDRREKKIPPFLLIVEEAHQLCPEGSTSDIFMARHILETIAREGRKFGASLCLISQRPKRLSTTILSQCNSQLILRIVNPYDIKHIEESSEGIDRKSAETLSSLRVGEALLVGEAVNHPVFFKVRMNKSAPSKHELSLEDAAKQFEEKKEKEVKELGPYL